jgi:hypothetical protein
MKNSQSLTRKLLNPNGSLAELDGDTSVIYKVMKQNNASLNVAQEMMEAAQKNQKKKK